MSSGSEANEMIRNLSFHCCLLGVEVAKILISPLNLLYLLRVSFNTLVIIPWLPLLPTVSPLYDWSGEPLDVQTVERLHYHQTHLSHLVQIFTALRAQEATAQGTLCYIVSSLHLAPKASFLHAYHTGREEQAV